MSSFDERDEIDEIEWRFSAAMEEDDECREYTMISSGTKIFS